MMHYFTDKYKYQGGDNSKYANGSRFSTQSKADKNEK